MPTSILNPRALGQTMPSVFERKKETFPNAALSVSQPDHPSLKLQVYTCWEVTGPALDIFNDLRDDIENLLKKHEEILAKGEEKPTAIDFQMFMVGTQPAKAHPTIVFSSKSARLRKSVKAILKADSILDDHPYVRIKTLDKMPALPHSGLSKAAAGSEDDKVYLLGGLYKHCGTQVELGRGRKAILGGIILIRDKYFGITAQHARWENEDPLDGLENTTEPLCFDEDSDDESEDSIETTNKGNMSSVHDIEGFPRSFEVVDAENFTEGGAETTRDDSINTSQEHDEAHQEWQPTCATSRSATASEPSFREKIAKLDPDSTHTSLDYEIFEIKLPEFHEPNSIYVPAEKEGLPKRMITTTLIAQKPAERAVWAALGDGPVKGTLLAAAHYLKMRHSQSFQEMWVVRLERPTTFGDCGAWVIDESSGELYGHVVAGDPLTGLTYIIPAHAVAADIKLRFGVEPSLPSWQSETAAEDTVDKDVANQRVPVAHKPCRGSPPRHRHSSARPEDPFTRPGSSYADFRNRDNPSTDRFTRPRDPWI